MLYFMTDSLFFGISDACIRSDAGQLPDLHLSLNSEKVRRFSYAGIRYFAV